MGIMKIKRTHLTEQLVKLCLSLREFGFINLVIIDQDFKIRYNLELSIKLKEKLEELGYRNVTTVLNEKGAVQVNGLIHDTTYTLTETQTVGTTVKADWGRT